MNVKVVYTIVAAKQTVLTQLAVTDVNVFPATMETGCFVKVCVLLKVNV